MDDYKAFKDEALVKTIEVGNNKLFIKREDPFGFWYINYERGTTPEALKGAYTSSNGARAAIDFYLANKAKTTTK